MMSEQTNTFSKRAFSPPRSFRLFKRCLSNTLLNKDVEGTIEVVDSVEFYGEHDGVRGSKTLTMLLKKVLFILEKEAATVEFL